MTTGQTEIADKLIALTEKMASGDITEATLNSYKLLWCQQVIVNMTVKSGKDLMTLEKASLVSTLDAVCELLFYGQWKSCPPEIQEAEEVAEDVTAEEA